MKLHYRTKPWPHQARVLKRMVRQRGGGIQVPMRWGKSWVGIYWAAALWYLEDVDRVLVITVTSALGVWEDQIQQHCPVPWRVISHHGEVLSEGEPEGEWSRKARLEFMLVNYQNLYSRAYTGEGREWVVVSNRTLHRFRAQAVIGDESHHLGNPNSEQSKQACALARLTRFRLFMTGTMFHRKPFFVFGQMKFYDDGRTFGTAFTHFKDKIAIFRDPQKYVLLRYRNLKWMMRQVKPVVYIERDVPKRPPVRNLLRFDLTKENRRIYNAMERDRVVRVKKEVLAADIVLTQHLWLMMMAGGFVKLPDSRRYVQIGDDKLRMCEDRLKEYMVQDIHKVVIGCRFVPELGAIARAAKRVGFQVVLFHGGIPAGRERHRRTMFFQNTDKPTVFVSQISAGKEGIELSAADTILWYSLTQSYVEFSQFGERTKLYNDTRTHMHDFLLARGSRDEVTLEAMNLKMDVAELLVTDPQRVEQITAARR